MEAQDAPLKKKGYLRHDWHRLSELLSNETASYFVCKRCGVILRADGKNKRKKCPGIAKITLRDKDAD